MRASKVCVSWSEVFPRSWPLFQGYGLDDPGLHEALDAMQGEFAVVIHVGAGGSGDVNRGCTPQLLRQLAQRFPRLDIVACHFGGYRMTGGLNLLCKLLGKPGKMSVQGDMVYEMYKSGRVQEINDYCMFDTLDTYFVFLRTRVLTGEINLKQEQELIAAAKDWLRAKSADMPALAAYLDNWGEWTAWP